MITKWMGNNRGFRFVLFCGLLAILFWPLPGAGQSNVISIGTGGQSTIIIPSNVQDRLGASNSMAVADFNDDGFQDILLGAPNADRPGNSETADNGVVYVIYGRDPFPPEFDLRSLDNADVTIIGADFGDHLGTAVAAGDVNGDGISDLILGAPDADGPLNQDSSTGEVYVIWGSTSLPQQIDLRQTTPPFRVLGRTANAGFGRTLTAMDFNGDGLQDVIIGQPQGNGPGGSRPNGGNVVVYFGAIDLVSPIPNVGFKRPDVTIFGRRSGDMLGSALSQGDFNADGLQDLVIGAPLADGPAESRPDSGEVYVLSGSRDLPAIVDLNFATTTGTGSLRVLGSDAGDRLGSSVDGGNANGDGFDDLLIGAPMAAGPDNVRGFSGEVLLILGQENLPPVIDPLENGDVSILVYGESVLDGLGGSVLLSDIDGDGLGELVLGASNAKGLDDASAGAGDVFIIKGRTNLVGASRIDLLTDKADTVIHGAETGDAFGSALAIGHLEGDEKGNLLVGAVGADGPGGRTDSGLVYVFLAAVEEPADVTADAGPDWCVVPGTALTLDASASKDSQGNALTYLWSIVSKPEGSQAVLSDPAVVNPSFTADELGDYVFSLTVTNPSGISASDEVTVSALTKGDVNFDGKIDAIDAQLVAGYIVGSIELTYKQKYAADALLACLPDENAIDVNDVRWVAEFQFKPDQILACTEPFAKPRA